MDVENALNVVCGFDANSSENWISIPVGKVCINNLGRSIANPQIYVFAWMMDGKSDV